MASDSPEKLEVKVQEDRSILVTVSGDWKTEKNLPDMERIRTQVMESSGTVGMKFDCGHLSEWDSGLIIFLLKCRDLCEERGIDFHFDTLPGGIRRLLELARSVPESKEARRGVHQAPFLEQIGHTVIRHHASIREAFTFVGNCVLAGLKLLRGKAQFRWSDTALIAQQCGVDALPIVALINFLVGMILGFVGAIQLRQFGATIYVADLVAVAMAREMACIMTGIIMCGRTGAAFAAQLGTMKVNEEIDAFKTFGFSPVEFLVLPRMLALSLMMPLLCVFAVFVGILGGLLVLLVMDVSFQEYFNETVKAMTLTHFFLGIFKGSVFGILIAATGCLRGIQCGTSAAAVGLATTSAVVTGITLIIASDAVFAVLCNVLNI